MKFEVAGIGKILVSLLITCGIGAIESAAQLTASTLPPLDSQNLSSLQNQKAILIKLLHRIEDGAAPCFTPACQNQKRQQVFIMRQQTELLPESAQFFSAQADGLTAAARMIRNPTPAPSDKNYFPKTLSEWTEWWKRRYSHEGESTQAWSVFFSQVDSLDLSLQTLRALDLDPHTDWNAIGKALDLGLLNYAEAIVGARGRSDQIFKLRAQKKEAEARALEVAGLKAFAEIHEIEQKLPASPQIYLKQVFPTLSYKDGLTLLYAIDQFEKWSGASVDLLTPAGRKTLLKMAADVKGLLKAGQNFIDLEYGILGLNNFESAANPAYEAAREQPIQEFLDEVDGKIEWVVDIAAFCLQLNAARLIFGAGTLASMAFPSAINIFQIWDSKDGEVKIWNTSTLSQSNKARLVSLQDSAANRREHLLTLHQVYLGRLAQIDQVLQLKNNLNQEPTP